MLLLTRVAPVSRSPLDRNQPICPASGRESGGLPAGSYTRMKAAAVCESSAFQMPLPRPSAELSSCPVGEFTEPSLTT
jgi:hypothetical protein